MFSRFFDRDILSPETLITGIGDFCDCRTFIRGFFQDWIRDFFGIFGIIYRESKIGIDFRGMRFPDTKQPLLTTAPVN